MLVPAQGFSLPVAANGAAAGNPGSDAVSAAAGTPEQQVHQAAAAAAAAAAVMSSPYSTYSTMMLPPSIIPLGETPGSSKAVLGCHGRKHDRDYSARCG